MEPLHKLALKIDAASDAADEAALATLGNVCRRQLRAATNQDGVALHFYGANTYSDIKAVNRRNQDDAWSWGQPEGIKEVIALRQIILEPAFEGAGHHS